MAITNFDTNDPLAVNLWSESIDVEALKHTDIFPLIGDDANNVIHRNTEASTPQSERFSAPQAAIRAELVADPAREITVCGSAGPTLQLDRMARNINIYSLHRGRSRKVLVRIIPDGQLYRIEWPDIGLSDLTNLTRAKAAALEWAQQKVMTEDRKRSGARRMKSLNNFWWSSSYIRQNENSSPCEGE